MYRAVHSHPHAPESKVTTTHLLVPAGCCVAETWISCVLGRCSDERKPLGPTYFTFVSSFSHYDKVYLPMSSSCLKP